MSDHRHPRCITPAGGSPAETDVEMIAQLNRQLLAASAETSSARARVRELERQVAALICWGLVAFTDGALAPDLAGMFRAHLGTCPDCQAGQLELVQHDARMSELAAARVPRDG